MDPPADGGRAPDSVGDVLRLFEIAGDLLAVIDIQGRLWRLNPAGERQLGGSEQELAGTSVLDLIHPDDHEATLGAIARAGTQEEAVTVEVRLRTATGEHRWFRCSGRVDEASERIYVTAVDVDERRNLEETLRSRVRLEEQIGALAADLLVAEASAIHDCIVEGLGRLAAELGAELVYFVRASGRPGDTDLIEWTAPEVDSRLDDLAALPEREAAWWGDVLRAQEVLRIDDLARFQGERAELTREVLGRQGVCSLLLVPMPLRRRHAGFISMVRVSSPRRFSDDAVGLLRVAGEIFLSALDRAEAATALADAGHELAHRNRELERSNEELERFAHAAAHDLRAPLSRIEMAISSLRTELPDDGPGPALVQIAARGAAGLRTLIEDLLAYASAAEGPGSPGPVDLDELASTVVGDLDALVTEAGAQISLGRLGSVDGHASMLRQLLQNLVTNALTFRRDGVVPRIRIENQPSGAGTILSVVDNGIGIPPERREEVFGMFSRLHPVERFPGSGIGLATCAKVVGRLGGRMWIDDGDDGGTAVRVWLPR